ncbi:MAG: DNA-binding protein WhiA [Oscillospiraceae bacterium]|nr:DNA-binding protein WhiA [Oscillospiraceae bacterium]
MAASFSGSAKAEICRGMAQKRCCAQAACFGILLFCNSFGADGIRIITESQDLARNLPKMFKKAFGLEFDVQPDSDAAGKMNFQILKPEKIAVIMDAYGFDIRDTFCLHINLPVVEEDCCRAAFLKGAFLAGGSVTDPEKGYHLEFTTTHQAVARECYSLMEEVLGFCPKSAKRGGGHVLYMKQSEMISDFLTFLGAPVAAMGIMEAKLEKELNNRVNRRCNCDDANTSKVVEAAQEQLAAIRILQEKGLYQQLPLKLQQAATARTEHPELSLTELAAMMEPPITKPAMNHRLKKLIHMAQEATT